MLCGSDVRGWVEWEHWETEDAGAFFSYSERGCLGKCSPKKPCIITLGFKQYLTALSVQSCTGKLMTGAHFIGLVNAWDTVNTSGFN